MSDLEYLLKLMKLLIVLIKKYRNDDPDMELVKEGLMISNPEDMTSGLLIRYISSNEILLDVYFKEAFEGYGVKGKIRKDNPSFIKFLEKETVPGTKK
ncbi:MAG: hypothetical protein VYD54_14505 [Bdellovibrionota bacterium]|nr:hypothetical protein [Bdellovibrionota bacterium]